MNLKKLTLALTIGGLIMTSSVNAQTTKIEFPAASPAATLKQRIGLTDVEVTYSRPSLKGREMLGTVVPYGKVWRTGANAATKLVFSTPVKLNGHDLPAGTYALMTIPGKDEWTVILNKGTEQWGAYKYDEKQDVVRFAVKPVALQRPVETFTIDFNDIRDESATMDLAWDKTLVPIKMEVSYVADLEKQIEKVMASNEPNKPYFQAAAFWYNHNKDMNQAKAWIDEALKEREAFYMMYLKAQILERLGDKAAAVAASKRSLELAQEANDNAYIKMNENLLARLK